MAKRINAINAYRPRIVQGKAFSQEQYIEWMTRRSTLSAGVIKNVQESEIETLATILLDGRPVHTGIATYTLSITLDGRYEVHVRLDKRIAQELNATGAFQGQITNAENIGKSSSDLADIWDAEHPDDPVERWDGLAAVSISFLGKGGHYGRPCLYPVSLWEDRRVPAAK